MSLAIPCPHCNGILRSHCSNPQCDWLACTAAGCSRFGNPNDPAKWIARSDPKDYDGK